MTKYRNKVDGRITEPGDQIILWAAWSDRRRLGTPAEHRVTGVKTEGQGHAVLVEYAVRRDEGWDGRRVELAGIHETVRYADTPLTWDGVDIGALAEGQEVLVDWSGTWRQGRVIHRQGIQVVVTYPRNSTGDMDTRPMPRNRIMTRRVGQWEPATRYGYPAPVGTVALPYVRTATPPPAPEVLECIPGCKPPAAGQRHGSHEIGCPVFGAVLAARDGEEPVVDYRTGLGRAFRPGLDRMADQADPATRPAATFREQREAWEAGQVPELDTAGAEADAVERDAVLGDLEREGLAELAEEGAASVPSQRDPLLARQGAEVLAEIQAGDEAPEVPSQRASDEEFPELAPGRNVREVAWALHSPGMVARGRDAIVERRERQVLPHIVEAARLASDVRRGDMVVARRLVGLHRYVGDNGVGQACVIRPWAPGERPEGEPVWIDVTELVPAPVVRVTWGQLQGGEFLAEARGELARVADEGMWAPELATLAGAMRHRITVDTAAAGGVRERAMRTEVPGGVVRIYLDADEWWASLVAEDHTRPALLARRGKRLAVWPEAGDLPEITEAESEEGARVEYANWHADPRVVPRVDDHVTVFGAGPRGDGVHLDLQAVEDEIGTDDLEPGEVAWRVRGRIITSMITGERGDEITRVLRSGMFAWLHRG